LVVCRRSLQVLFFLSPPIFMIIVRILPFFSWLCSPPCVASPCLAPHSLNRARPSPPLLISDLFSFLLSKTVAVHSPFFSLSLGSVSLLCPALPGRSPEPFFFLFPLRGVRWFCSHRSRYFFPLVLFVRCAPGVNVEAALAFVSRDLLPFRLAYFPFWTEAAVLFALCFDGCNT